MIEHVYVIDVIEMEDADQLELTDYTYIANRRAYLYATEALKACHKLNKEWCKRENPIDYAIGYDQDATNELSEKDLLDLEVAKSRQTPGVDFTEYWKKLHFDGIFSVGELKVNSHAGQEAIHVPTDRKLEL